MYYKDPDDSEIELTVESFHTTEELNEWLATGAFNTSANSPATPAQLLVHSGGRFSPNAVTPSVKSFVRMS